ncbi:MAG TPA: hypothetical protein VN963_07405 [bacterium]|nr:hypothetical protein [bacterium]
MRDLQAFVGGNSGREIKVIPASFILISHKITSFLKEPKTEGLDNYSNDRVEYFAAQ